jgi:hypothetical protein
VIASFVMHVGTLFMLALVVAVISRTVTQEAIFAELQSWARSRSTAFGRKLAYPLQCQYCFSHWVAAGLTAVIGYTAVQTGSTAYDFLLTVFFLVGVANGFLIAYERATVAVKVQRTIDEFNRKQVELSAELITGHRLQNKLSELAVEQTEINMEGVRALKQRVDEHNAKVEVAEAGKQFPGFVDVRGGNSRCSRLRRTAGR